MQVALSNGKATQHLQLHQQLPVVSAGDVMLWPRFTHALKQKRTRRAESPYVNMVS